MDRDTFEDTISESKEESIAKAIKLLQEEHLINEPLKRPEISVAKVLVRFVLWLSVIGVFLFLCIHFSKIFHISPYILHSVAAIGCLLIIALKGRSMVCNSVLLYQKYAPETMRRSCLFTPSCSEYMLLAVEKYGVVVGVYKGIRRLLRCHQPNGGVDYP